MGGRSFFASHSPEFEPISQSTKRRGNYLQSSTMESRNRSRGV